LTCGKTVFRRPCYCVQCYSATACNSSKPCRLAEASQRFHRPENISISVGPRLGPAKVPFPFAAQEGRSIQAPDRNCRASHSPTHARPQPNHVWRHTCHAKKPGRSRLASSAGNQPACGRLFSNAMSNGHILSCRSPISQVFATFFEKNAEQCKRFRRPGHYSGVMENPVLVVQRALASKIPSADHRMCQLRAGGYEKFDRQLVAVARGRSYTDLFVSPTFMPLKQFMGFGTGAWRCLDRSELDASF